MPRRFVTDSRRVLADARQVASALGSPTLEAEHLLLAVTRRPATTAQVLAEAGLDEDRTRQALEDEFEGSLAAVGVSLGQFDLEATADRSRAPRWGTSAKLALRRSATIAQARDDRSVTPGHILIGVLRAPVGTVPRALERAGIDRVALSDRVAAML